jgi:hypothetical protein
MWLILTPELQVEKVCWWLHTNSEVYLHQAKVYLAGLNRKAAPVTLLSLTHL